MNIIRPVNITDTVLTVSDVPEVDEAEFNIATTYAIGDRVMVTTTGTHSIYVSLVSSNIGNQPEDDNLVSPTNWARESATNRWAMFSDQLNDQTEQADVITVELLSGELVNGLALFNVEAQEVRIVMTDPIDGVVYDTTFNLIDDSGVNNWYSWYFEAILRQDVLGALDLPPYANADITVTITNTGDVAKCGRLTMGSQRKLGDTDYGTNIGIVDYSRKERDTFGNPVIINRNFSKRADYAVTVDTAFVGTVQQTLSALKTTPMAWIGSVDFPSTIIYGYYKDFTVTLSNPTKSLLSIDVEGLT